MPPQDRIIRVGVVLCVLVIDVVFAYRDIFHVILIKGNMKDKIASLCSVIFKIQQKTSIQLYFLLMILLNNTISIETEQIH